MTVGDKLFKLRKEHHYTQDQLAEILGVSRQAISKWESNIAFPETDKLIKLCDMYQCSLDYLLRDIVQNDESQPVQESMRSAQAAVRSGEAYYCYEKRSERSFRGVPLWHINIGPGRTAKGIFAIGLKARGIVSVGLLSMGVVSVGLLSLGVLSIGLLVLGLAAAGCIAVGGIAMGAISVGILSIGALAYGEFAIGALAIGRYGAVGDTAIGLVAFGRTEAGGSSLFAATGEMSGYTKWKITSLLDENSPSYYRWAKTIFLRLL